MHLPITKARILDIRYHEVSSTDNCLLHICIVNSNRITSIIRYILLNVILKLCYILYQFTKMTEYLVISNN